MDTKPKGSIASTSQESGCQVDWEWLTGKEIASAESTLDRLTLTFRDGKILTVTAALWKGQAFLAFDPWKPRD